MLTVEELLPRKLQRLFTSGFKEVFLNHEVSWRKRFQFIVCGIAVQLYSHCGTAVVLHRHNILLWFVVANFKVAVHFQIQFVVRLYIFNKI